MKDIEAIAGYRFASAANSHAHAYLLPTVQKVLSADGAASQQRRVFDLGCGNGSTAAYLASLNYEVTGVDPSTEGIQQANQAYPNLRLSVGSAYEDLPGKFGKFPIVISLEVVEHVYAPREFAKTLFNLVEPNGLAIVSTPYHGYLKNLILAATGKMDSHFTALWDHGHIKFWSIKTLNQLLREAGFQRTEFYRVGRIPQLAKSMVCVAHKGP